MINPEPCESQAYPGGKGVERNDKPRRIGPDAQKHSDPVQSKYEGKGHTEERMESQKGGEPQEDPERIGHGRSFGGVFDMKERLGEFFQLRHAFIITLLSFEKPCAFVESGSSWKLATPTG